jgi:Fe-S oxidoreductase
VLGAEESCTGDPAKRAGNEFLFQLQAAGNISVLNQYGIKKIVTACPHCFNSLVNEYPQLGGVYEVLHHTQFLQQLLLEGKIKVKEENAYSGSSMAYHDSCYLGRGNSVYEAPRHVLQSLKAELKELKRCRENGLCCGAGGSQMFKEEEKGKHRINEERAADIMESGVATVVTGCPFCMIMISDGLKTKTETPAQVMDVAEVLVTGMR